MHQPDEQTRQLPTHPHTDFESLSLSGKAIALGTVDIAPLADRIKKHNEGLGPGLTLARIWISVLQQLKEAPREDRDPKALVEKALEEEDARRDSDRQSFEADIAPVLLATGLRIGPTKRKGLVVCSETDFQPSQLAWYIGDASQFSAYLGALDAETITPSQKRGLKGLAHSLCTQLRSDYDYTQADDRLLSLVSAANAISTHFHRLDVPIKRLDAYLTAIRCRYIKDLIGAEKLNLDKPFGQGDKFTLHWHRDCNPDTLHAKWNEVIATLASLAGNPDAATVYGQAQETAHAAIKNSISEVSAWRQPTRGSYEERKPIFLKILKQMELRLSEF